MEEPHQRVQSGKLRVAPKKSYSSSNTKAIQEQRPVYPGIENAGELEIPNIDDSYDAYMQTPTRLSNLQVELLTRMAAGYGIPENIAIDRDWRQTWNIGTWCIGSEVSLSINIMQPNVANSWIGINTTRYDDVNYIIDQYMARQLSKSVCKAKPTQNGCQLQGRWGPIVVDELISQNIITRDDVEIHGLNITQSRIFCWVIVGSKSKYYCTLTKDSIDILMKYIPDWCADINEATSANNTTLRIKNPIHDNDSSQLSISTVGWIQYQGKYENLTKLPEAVSTAFRKLIKSIHLKTFLQSMEFQSIPNDF